MNMTARPTRPLVGLLSLSLLTAAACSDALTARGGSAPRAAASSWPGAPAIAGPALPAALDHAFTDEGGTLKARVGSASGAARATLQGERVTVAARDGRWALGLRTARIGRRAGLPPARPVEATRVQGEEVVLSRGAVEERYTAGPLGLEQSFRFGTRPEGEGALAVEVNFDGLVPDRSGAAGGSLVLRDGAGMARAAYRDLSAVDAAGRMLPSRMEVRGDTVTLVVDDAGAAYPVVVDPLVVVQQTELTASDGAAGDQLGFSVSIDGDTIVAGAPRKGAGAVYVFTRAGTVFSQQAEVTAGDGFFGAAVSVQGDTLAVGAPNTNLSVGAAYVFSRSGSTWTQDARIAAGDGATGNLFGEAVSLSGDSVLVGAWGADEAYVFSRSGTAWTQEAKLTAADGTGDDYFGISVSLDGDTAVVGAKHRQGDTGAAYVFVRAGTTWTQQAEILSPDGAAGDEFGHSVSLQGDTLLISAPGHAGYKGAAYTFTRSGTAWTQQAELTSGSSSDLGLSAALSGDKIILGALDHTTLNGTSFVFAWTGSNWAQQAQETPGDVGSLSEFGEAVSLSGNTAVVGAYDKASNGAAYVFDLLKGNGETCAASGECGSGNCVDGVCCDTACGSGATTDCQACSVAAGASADGTCGPISDTTPCDDGDACTQTDACQAGVCTGTSPVTCSAADACHTAGTCDSSAGTCSNPAKPDGDACPGGTCQGGACMPATSSSSSSGGTTSSSSSSSSSSGGTTSSSSSSSSSGGTTSSTSGSGGGSSSSDAGAGGGGGGGGLAPSGGCDCRSAGGGAGQDGSFLGAVTLGLLVVSRRRGARLAPSVRGLAK